MLRLTAERPGHALVHVCVLVNGGKGVEDYRRQSAWGVAV
jgi:hypothetical protein